MKLILSEVEKMPNDILKSLVFSFQIFLKACVNYGILYFKVYLKNVLKKLASKTLPVRNVLAGNDHVIDIFTSESQSMVKIWKISE